MLKTRFLFIFVVSMLAAACSFQEPTAEIVDVKLLSVTITHVKTEFVIEVDNPNSVGVTVTKIHYVLHAEGIKVVEETVTKETRIAANGKTRIELPARFGTTEMGMAGIAAASKKRLDYNVEAEITVRTPVGNKTLRESKKGSMSL